MPATLPSSTEAVAAAAPVFNATFESDLKSATAYFAAIEERIARHPSPDSRSAQERSDVRAILQEARAVRTAFFARHAAAMYAHMTADRTRHLRVVDLVYGAADKFPGLLPTRRQIDQERALQRQSLKEGREIDQGLFIAHVLSDADCGLHLIHAMLRPTRAAEEKLAEFVRTGFVDLGAATVERKGFTGEVTLTNNKFLNAEDDIAVAALETAVDLVLLDDQIKVGVLRGGVVDHPKYQGKRIFNAGINLTHLYYGRISLLEFLIERELGLVNKMYRGLWRSQSCHELMEDFVEKPWLAAVDQFAIGGGCQILCVMDRVIATPDAYFNLPASKEGFIPGFANLRFPRLVGIQLARQGIFFERQFPAATPEGGKICDELVPAVKMEDAIARNAAQMVRGGLVSTIANRKALRVGQEPLSAFRHYMTVYSWQQGLCLYDKDLVDNLERSWQPEKRRM
jgi:(3,5-dihydroxyphenyl)acetyl-CoA 1,2-dioxygenase